MIESTVVAHGDEFGGWTKLDGDELKVFDGRVTLRAQVHTHPKPGGAAMAQCSVLATLHDHGDEVLNGGVVGVAGSGDEALTSAAQAWLHLVAATIRSFIDGRAVAGCSHVSDAPGAGLDGFDGYVSPARWASFNGTQPPECPDGAPWFRYTREALGPARLQMVKTVVNGNTPDSPTGWRRQLELNGEGLTVTDTDWPAPHLEAPGYWTRFALVSQTDEAQMAERDRLDRAIESFATKLSARTAHQEIEKQMSLEGYDLEFIDEIGSFATAGFTRAFFSSRGMNFNFAPTVIRARASGEIEAGVPLASRPAFSRGMAVAARLLPSLDDDAAQAIGLVSGDANAALQAMNSSGSDFDPTQVRFASSIVPERGASQETMQRAVDTIRAEIEAAQGPRKPWWKFW